MLKVKVVVAMRMRMAAGWAQGWGKHVNKQLDESPMGSADECRGYTRHRRLLICLRKGFRLQRRDLMSVTGRPAFRRASMNEVNISPALLLPEYVSSCSLGKSSRGCSPFSDRRQREISPMSLRWTRRVFTLLNDLRSLRHSVRSTSLCSSDDKL